MKKKTKYTLMNLFWGFDGLDSEMLDESWDKKELEKLSESYEHSYILKKKVPVTEKLLTQCPRCGGEVERIYAFNLCDECGEELAEEEQRIIEKLSS